jgi:sugar phosphate isomerase/epimerase
MQVGICTSVANAGVLAQAGADYIEENVQGYLRPEEAEVSFAPAALPVRAACGFLPGKLKVTGPETHHAAIARYAATAFQRAKAAGIQTIVFGSGGSRKLPEGFPRDEARAQFIAVLKTIGPLAAPQGVTVVVEPLNRGECNFINSLAEGADLVAACNHPNVRLLADIYHMLRDGESPDAILAHGHWLQHVHVAEKAKRTAPGVAGDDFRPHLRALKAVNYRGAISFECGWIDLKTEAAGCLAAFRRQLEDVSC